MENHWLLEGGKSGILSFIGIILIKMGTSGVTLWGNVGVYYFSYLKQWEPDLTYETMQMTWSLAAVFMGIFSLFSVYVGERIGYATLVKFLCMVYPISLYRSSFCQTSQCFNLYQTFFVILAVGLGLMPILYCLWSFYSKNSGKATSVAMAVYGISAVVYTIYSLHYINPDNESAVSTINQKTNKNEMIFGPNITQKVPGQIRNLAIIQGIFCFLGAFLVKQNNFQLFKQKQDIEPIANEDEINEMNPVNKLEFQILDKVNQVVQRASYTKMERNDDQQSPFGENLVNKSISLTLKEALFSQPFIIIWITTMIMSLFALFIALNYKVYGLQKLNDDHLLTYISIGSVFVGSALNYFWGSALDNYSYKKIYFIIFLSFGIFGITFPLIPSDKYFFGFWYLALTSIERGLYTIIGPVLIKIFGLDMGSKVFPYKFTSWVVGLILAPAFGYFLQNTLNMDQMMLILASTVFVALIISTKLKESYSW